MKAQGAIAHAVNEFVDDVERVLESIANQSGRNNSSNSTDNNADYRVEAIVEAQRIVAAFINADSRHTDEELLAFTGAFGPLLNDASLAGTLPHDLRASSIISNHDHILTSPTAVFEIFVHAPQAASVHDGPATYYERAMAVAHAVVSLDSWTTPEEIVALSTYRETLLRAGGVNVSVHHQQRARYDETAHTNTRDAATPASTQHASTVQADVDVSLPGDERPLEELMAELDELVGLKSVKAQIKRVADTLAVQKLRMERGIATIETSKHLVFVGNPGTGKTTVARLIGQIYRSVGALERGQLVECSRANLVAPFVGQTAPLVIEHFAQAQGGVLFIDEAYTLNRGGSNDFGKEAIDSIVKEMEDSRGNTVLIVAGYPNEMDDFLDTNPGLASRFPTTIAFPDYTTNELIAIVEIIAEKSGYSLGNDAHDALRARLDAEPRDEGFGNGRLARNMFEAAVAQHASRLVAVESPTDEDLTTILGIDLVDVGNSNT